MDGALAIGTKLRARISQKTNVIGKPNSEDDAKQLLIDKEEISYSSKETPLEVGSRVEALYHGRGRRYYKGSIASVHDDGSYDIQYDDGDQDSRLAAEFIKRISTSSRPTSSKTKVETTIERRLHHKDNKRRESVDVEMNVAADDTSQEFQVGDRIEARYKGKGKRYYKGKIVAVLDDGSYDIDYDDGDKDRGLSGIHVRARVPRSSTKANKEKRVPVSIEHVAETNKDDLEAEKNRYDDNRLPDDTQIELKSSIRSPVSFVVPVRSEDDKRDDNLSLEEEEIEACEKEETIPSSEKTFPLSKGNRLYKGVVSKVKIVHLYEIKYKDGTRDVNIPFEALCMDDEEVSPSDIQEGSTVKVLGYESRLLL